MKAATNRYSQRFSDFLRKAAPDLQAALKPDLDKGGKPTGFLLAEISSPNVRATGPLWIGTHDDEITVGFDEYHAHFETCAGACSEEQAFASALSMVRDIQTDRRLVASWWYGVHWCGSETIERGATPEWMLSDPGPHTPRVRSWSGRYDQWL